MSYFGTNKIKAALLVYPGLLLLVSFVLPVVQLAQGAGSLQNYLIAFNNFKGNILYSIYVAGISSIVMVIFSLTVAYYIERSESVFKSLLDYLTQMPFGIPSIVLGIGLIRVWNRPGFGWIYDTSVILMIGYIAGYCPFIIRIVLARIKQINREMEEAALLANCGRLRFVLKILLPLFLPGIIAGLLAGFVLSIANLGTALLVVPAGKLTLPITIYNFMHYGSDNMVFALSLILIIIVTILMVSLYPVYRVSTRKVNL
jgi:iron(III) transport system permease protein